MTISTYWLSQWISEYEIRADWEIGNALSDKGAVDRLDEILEEAATRRRAHQEYPSRADVGESIVAGTRIDLSGIMSCYAYECMQGIVDSTFTNIWHYFDRIVVEGLDPMLLHENRKRQADLMHSSLLLEIATQARLILYLKSIGADDYLIFVNKPHAFCADHWIQHAKDLGIEEAFDANMRKQIVDRIARSSKFKVEPMGPGRWGVSITGKYFAEQGRHFLFSSTTRPTQKHVAQHVLDDCASALIADVSLARNMKLPLVEATVVPGIGKDKSRLALPSEQSVALELDLPVFTQIDTAGFLRLREDQRPYFERFRSALREAIREQLTPENSGKSAGEIAQNIESDYLRPGLADIERRVRNNRTALTKKIAASIAIGGSAAAISALASVPVMIAGGVAAFGTSLPLTPLLYQYIDERDSSIPMADLYFLWSLGKHRKHR